MHILPVFVLSDSPRNKWRHWSDASAVSRRSMCQNERSVPIYIYIENAYLLRLTVGATLNLDLIGYAVFLLTGICIYIYFRIADWTENSFQNRKTVENTNFENAPGCEGFGTRWGQGSLESTLWVPILGPQNQRPPSTNIQIISNYCLA